MDIPTRKTIIEKVRRKGLKIAGILPIHYPRALLRAFGFHPMELWGPPGISQHGENGHFPEYTCAVARNATAFLTGEGGKIVDCVLVPHTCDSLQGMSSLLQGYVNTGCPEFTLYNPRETSPAAEIFLAGEIERLFEKLRVFAAVSPTDADLHEAIDRENEADQAFNRLCLNRNRFALSNREFYTLLRSREYLPLEDFLALVPPEGKAPEGVPIMMSGIVPEPMALFDHLTAHGALVAGDDLACCGRRVYQPLYDKNPYLRMAKQLLSKPPDPTAGHDVAERIDHVVKRMEQCSAKGIIVYNVKFCEPELFFLPLQRKALEERGWPTLYLEEALPETIPHQTLTRMEAFLEVLQ